jgi:hypothetical protein
MKVGKILFVQSQHTKDVFFYSTDDFRLSLIRNEYTAQFARWELNFFRDESNTKVDIVISGRTPDECMKGLKDHFGQFKKIF